MHPALIEFAAKMAARCKTELAGNVEWAVTMTNGAGFDDAEVRVVWRFEGRKASGVLTPDMVLMKGLDQPARMHDFCTRMWNDFVRHLGDGVVR